MRKDQVNRGPYVLDLSSFGRYETLEGPCYTCTPSKPPNAWGHSGSLVSSVGHKARHSLNEQKCKFATSAGVLEDTIAGFERDEPGLTVSRCMNPHHTVR